MILGGQEIMVIFREAALGPTQLGGVHREGLYHIGMHIRPDLENLVTTYIRFAKVRLAAQNTVHWVPMALAATTRGPKMEPITSHATTQRHAWATLFHARTLINVTMATSNQTVQINLVFVNQEKSLFLKILEGVGVVQKMEQI